MRRAILLTLLLNGGCVMVEAERIPFAEAARSEKPTREPRKKKEPGVLQGPASDAELQGALLRLGATLRTGRQGAQKGAVMPAALTVAWDTALAGVEVFLKKPVAEVTAFDVVRARVVLESERETDAGLWGDFPRAVADRSQATLEALKTRLGQVNALRLLTRSVDLKRFIWPLQPVVVTSPFGFRVHPISGDYKEHKGVDLIADPAQPVYAPYSGTVVFAGWSGAYGRHVEVQHDMRVSSTFSHLQTLLVKEGDVLKRGQLVGLAGDSGNATGVHLHFELYRDGHPIDPEAVLPPTVDLFHVASTW